MQNLVTAFLCLMLTTTFSEASSQSTNYSGTWTLKERTVITGKLAENGVPYEMKIQQSSDSIKIERTTIDEKQSPYVISESIHAKGDVSTSLTPKKESKAFYD